MSEPASPACFPYFRVVLTSAEAKVQRDRIVLRGTAGEAQDTVRTLLGCGSPVDAVGAATGDELAITIDTTEWPSWLMVRLGDAGETPIPTADVADRVLGLLTRHRLDQPSGVPRLHAAAVADSTGRTVLLLGDSGAGKSTLAAHLVAGGLELISDEQVAVHGGETVSGFTRPIAVKPGGVVHLPALVEPLSDSQGLTTLVAPEALGGRHRLIGRPALVVVIERDANAATPPSVTPLDAAEAFQALAANNLDMVQIPVEACSGFAALASTVPAVTLRYSSSAEASETVRELLDNPPPAPAAEWTVDIEPPDAEMPTEPARSANAITVHLDTAAILFHRTNRSVVTLNEQATEVWRSLPGVERTTAVDRFLLELHEADLVTGLDVAED